MVSKKPENMNFEAMLEELGTIVESLETGDFPLEESLKKFERGISLTKASQNKLTQAEQRVSILVEKNSDVQLTDFKSTSLE